MAGDGDEVVRNTGDVGADVAAAVLDAGVEEGEVRNFEELAGGEGHEARVLVRHTELEVVEHVDVLDEATGVGHDLVRSMALETASESLVAHIVEDA